MRPRPKLDSVERLGTRRAYLVPVAKSQRSPALVGQPLDGICSDKEHLGGRDDGQPRSAIRALHCIGGCVIYPGGVSASGGSQEPGHRCIGRLRASLGLVALSCAGQRLEASSEGNTCR